MKYNSAKSIKRALSLNSLALGSLIFSICGILQAPACWAKDVNYEQGEIMVNVTPGEPTQIGFPGTVAGGFKKSTSALNVTPKKNDLVIFSNDNLPPTGEALIVRLEDGRSYSLRVRKADSDNPRDDMITIHDERSGSDDVKEDDVPPWMSKSFDMAPPTQVSGLMREMVLVSELGKKSIPGYRISDQHKGQQVLNDGTIVATIDKIFVGQTLWGYVLDAKNVLGETQRLNPASFRLDGTRAVSFQKWELAPAPLDIEQQISGADRTKVYIVTRAKR